MVFATNASENFGASSRQFSRDYKVEALVLGSGGAATVRVVTHRRSGTQYALKSFSTVALPEAKLGREAEIHASLDHPNIVRLHQSFRSKDKSHLVMERLCGGDLFDRLSQRGHFSESQAATAMSHAISAVAYMHGLNLCHRDLKLDNFVYQSVGGDHLKLIDFGCACHLEPGCKLSSFCGTLEYVAPEVFEGAYDEKADVWSLGVMAFLLLVGRTPWSGSDKETCTMIRAGKPSFPAELFDPLSSDAKSFVRSLFAVHPSARPSAAEALSHPWIRATGSRPAVDRALAGNLQRFAQMPTWRRACLALAAGELPDEVGRWARDQFAAVGADHSALISAADLRQLLAPEVELAGIAINGDDIITHSNFLAAAVPEQALLTEAALHCMFERLDVVQCGRLTAEDMAAVLGMSCEELGIGDLFSRSTGGEGLSFDDFCRTLCGNCYRSDVAAKLCDHGQQPENCDLWRAARVVAAGRYSKIRQAGGDDVEKWQRARDEQAHAEIPCIASVSSIILSCLGGIHKMFIDSQKSS